MPSSAFTISTGPAVKLAIYQQPPASAIGGQPLSRNPVVVPSDAGGNYRGVEAAHQVVVTATIGVNGAVIGLLQGAKIQIIESSSSSKCVANFTDLSLTRSGAGYTIIFTSFGLLPVESTRIDVVTGPVTQLLVVRCASRGNTRSQLSPQPVIRLVDAGGNRVVDGKYNIRVRLLPSSSIFSSNMDYRFHGNTTVRSHHGQAYFYDLSIRAARSDWNLIFFAENSTISSVVSSNINITAMPGSVTVQVDVSFSQTLAVGSTSLSREEQLIFIESLAEVLGVSPEDLEILDVFMYAKGTETARRRRRLHSTIEYQVIIKFIVILLQDADVDAVASETTTNASSSTVAVTNVLAKLTKDSLQSTLQQHGIQVHVQELQTKSQSTVVQEQPSFLGSGEDLWSGWWVLNTSRGFKPGGMALRSSNDMVFGKNNTLELMYQVDSLSTDNEMRMANKTSYSVACSGSVHSSIGAVECFTARSADGLRNYLFASSGSVCTTPQCKQGIGPWCAVTDWQSPYLAYAIKRCPTSNSQCVTAENLETGTSVFLCSSQLPEPSSNTSGISCPSGIAKIQHEEWHYKCCNTDRCNVPMTRRRFNGTRIEMLSKVRSCTYVGACSYIAVVRCL